MAEENEKHEATKQTRFWPHAGSLLARASHATSLRSRPAAASDPMADDYEPKPDEIVVRYEEPDIAPYRTIWVRDFGIGAAKEFYEELEAMYRENPEKPVLVMVASYGGYVDGLFAMVDAINAFPFEVWTCCFGVAMSCGAVLLSAGTKGRRYSLRNATVMIHEITGFIWAQAPDIKNEAEEAERINTRVLTILAENCGMTFEELMTVMRGQDGAREHYFDADGAKTFGIVDEIVESLPNIIPMRDAQESPEPSTAGGEANGQ